ncbi:hypothetical protein QTP88_007420 [Uroleucon formosanum]
MKVRWLNLPKTTRRQSTDTINIKSTLMDRGSQDEENNHLPYDCNPQNFGDIIKSSREKTQHATGYFDQTTTKTEDPKKHREIHPANNDRYDPVCNSLEHRRKSIVRCDDDADSDSRHTSAPTSERRSIRSQNGLDRNFDADTRCATARFVRHRELARRKGQQRGSYMTQTIITNQTQGFALWVNS